MVILLIGGLAVAIAMCLAIEGFMKLLPLPRQGQISRPYDYRAATKTDFNAIVREEDQHYLKLQAATRHIQ